MLDYAVTIYFDPATEANIKATIAQLAESGRVSPAYRNTGMRPHLTLAEFNTDRYEEVQAVLRSFASVWPAFPIRLGSIGIFPVEPGVLFYAPIVDDILFAFHRNLNNALRRCCTDFSPLYQERNWVAHCTLALNLTTQEIQDGIAMLSPEFAPIDAQFAGIDVFACCPFRCQETFPLPTFG